MDHSQFKRILTAFADNSSNIDVQQGRVLVEIRDEVIEAVLKYREGSLRVEENGETFTAEQWLINRVARLPQLAERILNYIPQEKNFVTPAARLLERLDISPEEAETDEPDAVVAALRSLNQRLGGVTSVIYLTSDAGEGKTTLINHLARSQAEKYRKKETDWLLVPVTLGGRPFMRLDDVVVGELANRLKFLFLYYQAFVELIRMGVIVLALDGFEEMFVETNSGEATSALGNLMQSLESSGTTLIASRRAFFEYQSFRSQGRLFDTLRPGTVSFARLQLQRWTREQFISYCVKRNVRDGFSIYDEVSSLLGPLHPLLTRAVLARRLLDVAVSPDDRLSFLQKITQSTPSEFFTQFIDAIIQREAREKWISNSGEPRMPLLSVNEHHELLSLLAGEMWINKTDELKADIVDVVAELFCEKHKKPVSVSRQVTDRLKQHALIIQKGSEKNRFSFDHEEFRNYFLGEAIGRSIADEEDTDIRALLRVASFPHIEMRISSDSVPLSSIQSSVDVADIAIEWLRKHEKIKPELVAKLQRISQFDGPASFTRENCGAIILRLLNNVPWSENNQLRKVTFPKDSLKGRHIKGVKFEDCYFQPTRLDASEYIDCSFHKCEFERLELPKNYKFQNVQFSDTIIRSLWIAGSDTGIFEPGQITSMLEKHGVIITGEKPIASQTITDSDERLVLAIRAFRAFLRSTEVNEYVLRARLGKKAGDLFREVIPKLVRAGILKKVTYEGSSPQEWRFRLNVSMERLAEAESQCSGSFDRFLELIDESPSSSSPSHPIIGE